MLAELKFLFLLLLFLTCASFSTKQTPTVFVRLPRDANIKIMNIQGYDYKVAWWLWGPDRLKEQEVILDIPAWIVKRKIVANTCEGEKQ